jgi:hypothetical protein
MSGENIASIAAATGHIGEVAERTEITRMLAELAEGTERLFCSEVGAETSRVGRVIAVDAQQQLLRIAFATGEERDPSIPVGVVLEAFVPLRNADLVFTTTVTGAVPGSKNTYDLVMPPRLHLWYKREHPRGPCFGLVEVILRRKGQPQDDAVTGTLRDISNAGLGISLADVTDPKVRVGDAFDDCLLLLNSKPMAACAIEVLHTRREPQTRDLIAGARFARLDDVARTRIEKLIAVLDPLWGEPAKPTVDIP